MQALVESEKWKHAPADLVSEVCHRTTTALGDKSFRTVAHMQLARSLATMNPGTLNVYGACLIHAAEEVLSSSTYSWQHRKCAAKMAQAVLAIVDRETLSLEFHSVTQVSVTSADVLEVYLFQAPSPCSYRLTDFRACLLLTLSLLKHG